MKTATKYIAWIFLSVWRGLYNCLFCLANKKPEMLPLIRLSILYHDERQQYNAIRLGQQFNGMVANPEDVFLYKLLLKRERKPRRDMMGASVNDDMDMPGVRIGG